MQKILLVSAAVIAFASCSTNLYVPNAVNAPLLAERGEVKVNLTHTDLQVAAAVARHVGIMANGYFSSHTAKEGYEHRGSLLEAGIGYFSTTNTHMAFEGFVGYGIGNVFKKETYLDDSEHEVKANFNATGSKIFIQPDFGFRSKIFDFVLTPRISVVKYSKFTPSNYTQSMLEANYLANNNLTTGVYVFAEPALTVRVGYKFMKLQLQYGRVMNMNGRELLYPNTFSTIGLVVDIARWYDADKQTAK